MVRLARKNQKIFAENATNNGVFGSLQTGNPELSNDIEKIQSLPAYSQGWNAATMTAELLPPLEEFQAIQYMITRQMAYFFQEGIPEWGSDVVYYEGGLAKQSIAGGMRIYSSKTNDNQAHPVTDTTNWQKVFDTSDPYAFTTWVNQQLALKEDLSNKVNTLENANETTYPTTSIVKNTVEAINTAVENLTQQINLRQLISNIAQNLTSPNTTTYPSTRAVANESSRIIGLMNSNTFGLVVAESNNYYIKLTNGFTIQWGDGIGTITFPKPFRTTVYGVSVTRNYQSYEWVPTVDDKTATNMLIRTCDRSGVYRQSASTLRWVAMGF